MKKVFFFVTQKKARITYIHFTFKLQTKPNWITDKKNTGNLYIHFPSNLLLHYQNKINEYFYMKTVRNTSKYKQKSYK